MATNNQITFKYKYADDYNPKYINGAHGGINPQGEIIVNFYFERAPIPDSITYDLKSTGDLGGVKATKPEDLPSSVVRYVQSGVVMNLDVAKQIYNWLGNQIKIREKQIEIRKKTSK